jgi:hypothetical protein
LRRKYVLAGVLLVLVGGCRGRGGEASKVEPGPGRLIDPADALRPDVFAKALRKMGGAHFHGTARFVVGPNGQGTPVTTTTDVWIDRSGNYRLREENDQDGGREVVLHGRELAVALRYGKMIRRVAEEPEPSRLLEEALGAPWAAFELAAPASRVTRSGEELVAGAKASVYDLALDPDRKPGQLPAGARPAVGLRGWRKDATVQAVSGRAVIDDRTGAAVRVDLNVRFAAKPQDGPVAGTIQVHAELSEIASTAPIARPEPPQAQELAFRQRIVPEQRELLRGLPQAPAPPGSKRPVKTLPPGSVHPLLRKGARE